MEQDLYGSHVCELLNKLGYEVVVLDNLSSGNPKFIVTKKFNIKFINGDIRRINDLEEIMKNNVKTVIHLAAMNEHSGVNVNVNFK